MPIFNYYGSIHLFYELIHTYYALICPYYASIHPYYVSIQFILLQETAKDNRKPFEFFTAQIKLFSRICKVSYIVTMEIYVTMDININT